MTKFPFLTPPVAALPNSLSAPAPLRFLVVQASEADFDRLILHLREEDVALGHAAIRFETPRELRELCGTEALKDCDLVIANDLPDLRASAAVKILRAGCDDIPVIVLLGAIGEDRAVDLMRAGASDCVRKDQFGRLALAVRRELRHAKTRREYQDTHENISARKRAEVELPWKAAVFEAQTNSSIDGILVVDQQGRHILQNQRLADLFKIPPHIAGDDDDEQQLRWVAGVVRDAEQFIERVTYLYAHPNEISRDEVKLKDGTTLDRYSSPVFGRKGEYYGRLWTFRDVTGARSAEEALRESEERFSGAFEHAPIGIALASLDGRWIKVNRALCNLIGYSEAELLTRSFCDVTHPEDLEISLANVRRILAGEIPCSHLEKRYVHRNGHSMMVALSLSLVRDRRGKPSYLIAHIQDITERRQAEMMARESKKRYRSLVDSARDAIFSVAPDGTFTSLNPACEAIGEISSADWIGKSFAPMVHPDDLPLATEMMHRMLRGEQTPVHELRGNPSLNRPATLEMTLAAQKDDSGKIIGVLGVGRDITERKRTEEAVRERARLAALDAAVRLALACGDTMPRTLRFCCEEIVHHLDAAFARVWIYNAQQNMLELAASSGLYTHLDGAHGRVPVGKFKIGLIAEERKPHLTNHVVGDPRVGDQDWAKREGMVAFAGYPLLVEGHLMGVVAMFARHALSDATLNALAAVASNIAVSIERKRSEAAFRESEKRFAGAFEHAPIGMAMTLLDGRFLKVNRALCDLTGYSENELLDRTHRDITHPDDLGVSADAGNRTIVTESPSFQIEKRYVHRRGHVITVLVNGSLIRNGDGQPTYFIVQIQDITERKLASALLIESRKRLALATESAQMGIWDWDVASDKLVWDAQMYALYGIRVEDFTGAFNSWQNALHPEDRARTEANFATALNGNCGFHAEFRIVRPSGEVRYIEAHGIVQHADDGPATHLVGVNWDITKRKRAEESLWESDQKFKQLADNITDAFWIRSPDMSVVHYVSPAFERIWGRSVETLYANPETWADFIFPEDRQRVKSTFAALVREAPRINIEYRIVRPDGEIRWVHVRGFQVRDAANHLIRHIGIVTDITERRIDEEKLRESKRFAESVAENSTSFIYIYDLETKRSVYSNHSVAEFLGYSQAQILEHGDNILPTIMHPEDLPRIIRHHAHFAEVADNRVFDLEFRLKHASGDWRWVWARETVFKRRPDGAAWEIMGTAQDVTERKRAEAELEDLHRQLMDASRRSGMAEIATNVLHNVGNVLNSVNVSTELITRSVKKSRISNLGRVAALLREHEANLAEFMVNNPQGQRLPAYLAHLSESLVAEQTTAIRELESLRRNVEHINDIVAMQQNYAKFGALNEIVNVTELVEDSLRMSEGALTRHRIEVVREFGSVPSINVEKHKILQILVNLLHNAKHACQNSECSDKWLKVRVANGDDRVTISVTDNGMGIPAENLTRIFNHGFTTRTDGHGFGLHSSALAAKEMGGSLTAHSDGPGQGAVFTLELPCPPQKNEHVSGHPKCTTKGRN